MQRGAAVAFAAAAAATLAAGNQQGATWTCSNGRAPANATCLAGQKCCGEYDSTAMNLECYWPQNQTCCDGYPGAGNLPAVCNTTNASQCMTTWGPPHMFSCCADGTSACGGGGIDQYGACVPDDSQCCVIGEYAFGCPREKKCCGYSYYPGAGNCCEADEVCCNDYPGYCCPAGAKCGNKTGQCV